MPYLDIVFHNLNHGGNPVNQNNSRNFYTSYSANVNVYQTVGGGAGQTAGAAAAAPPSAAWGASITGAATACGIFFCESHAYLDPDYNRWDGNAPAVPAIGYSAVPNFPVNHLTSGFTPFHIPFGGNPNTICAFLGGDSEKIGGAVGGLPRIGPAAQTVSPPDDGGGNPQALDCLGTGALGVFGAVGNAPWGSDRYALLFQVRHRVYPGGGGNAVNRIKGLFVHTKNTHADTSSQLIALCNQFNDHIIFGDLNFDLRLPNNLLKRESFGQAISGTHSILAIERVGGGGQYYFTRHAGNAFGAPGTSTIDFALVPNARTAHIELWSQRLAGGVPTLQRNASDHAVMMLRIRCN